jgi:hypothetical protein
MPISPRPGPLGDPTARTGPLSTSRSRPAGWPLALAVLVAAAAATWATRAPAVRTASPPRPPASEVMVPQDARTAALVERSARRGVIARAVARRQVGLLAAAAEYRDLAAADPAGVETVRRAFPGGSDDERFARVVIQRVRVELELQAGDRGAVARLEAELAGHLAAGPLRLSAREDAGDTPDATLAAAW